MPASPLSPDAMLTSRRLPLLAALAILLAACAPLGGRGEPPGGPQREGNREGAGAMSPIAALQADLQKTAEALALTPAQAVLWDAYQEKVGALMADQMKLQPYRAAARQNALRQIEQKIDVVRNRLAAMEDIQEAAGRLYMALDDKQKASADQLLARTVPALYSGFGGQAGEIAERSGERGGDKPGRGPGGGMGGPGGGMGGGFGRL